jgi:hypothetical protein
VSPGARTITRETERRRAGSKAGAGPQPRRKREPSITEPRKLAKRLSDDLRAVTGAKHLCVTYSSSVPPPEGPQTEMSPQDIERFKKQAAADNFGMPVAEIREGNVGYLLVLGFLPPEVNADAVEATMSKVADADVLVIDLRQNGGGSPEGVALMTSYLFGEKRVHLNDLYSRRDDRTESFYTSPDAPGRHFGGKKKIFVLVSKRTFSAGEEFAYNLKALKRATIIGEITGGGAHPTDFVRLSDHWALRLPSVPADQALDKALELVRKNPARAKK